MSVTTTIRSEMFRQETDDGLLYLLTLATTELSDSIRVVLNTEHITSRGLLFVGFPFELILPPSSTDSEYVAQLTIDNVGREVAESIRLAREPVGATIEVVQLNNPDYVELTISNLELKNVRVSALSVTGDLVVNSFLTEPFPPDNFTPGSFPGVFP